MKKFTQTALLVGSLLFAFSCNNTSTEKKIDYDSMAKAFCECMTPLLETQQKVMALSAEGKTDEIQALLADIEKMSESADKCVERLEAKYGVIEGEDEKKASVAFQKSCPEVAAMLNEAVEE